MKKPFYKARQFFDIEKPFFSYINLQKIPRKLFNYCPSSEPFLSDDAFRSLTSITYDNIRKCAAKDIKEHSIVYVRDWFLEEFIQKILPDISFPVTLIVHQSDVNITEKYAYIADNKKIKHIFAKNCLFQHHKITPIPLGMEDFYRQKPYSIFQFKKLVKIKEIKKKPAIVLAFSVHTNKEKRQPCYESLKNALISVIFPKGLNFTAYRKKLTEYMFVASPPGSGTDCFRTWEAIYLGVIPLVEDNFLNRYFVSLGLPMILVDDWNIPAKWTEAEAYEIYNKTIRNSNTDAAYLDYWKKIILEK